MAVFLIGKLLRAIRAMWRELRTSGCVTSLLFGIPVLIISVVLLGLALLLSIVFPFSLLNRGLRSMLATSWDAFCDAGVFGKLAIGPFLPVLLTLYLATFVASLGAEPNTAALEEIFGD